MSLKRRVVLAQLATQALAAAWPQGVSCAQGIVFDKDPFALGVASGQPTDSSVVLWTRLVSPYPANNPWKAQTLDVRWEIAADAGFTRIVKQGIANATAELSHSVHADVTGLTANTVYWYRFHAGAFTSPTGRTRTLPPADDRTTPLKVAFASCQRYHSGHFVAYEHMLADEPDLVVFLGDYIYEMGATTTEARGNAAYPANRIEDYRDLYELARSDPALQRMHAACPWLVIWDDHEVKNDYVGGPVRLGGEGGQTARRMAMGYRTWFEHMPLSLSALTGGVKGLLDNTHELRTHGSVAWGQLAQLHLLDTRQFRSRQASCGMAGLFSEANCPDLNDAGRDMLGPEQARWLDRQLRRNAQGSVNPSLWNLICQPLVFSRFTVPISGGVLNHDNWDGYPAARKSILNTLEAAQVSNPVIWGGDIHQNWAAHVHRQVEDNTGPVIAPEFCVTSITTASFGGFTAREMQELSPHCVYTDRHARGYAMAHITPERLSVRFRHVDLHANTVRTAAHLTVNPGSPLIQLQTDT